MRTVELTFPATIPATVARAQSSIIEDVMEGIVPVDVPDFASLHDFVDANGYGGFFEGHPAMDLEVQDSCDFVNEVQDQLDAWIRAGGIPQGVAIRNEQAADTAAEQRESTREYFHGRFQ